MPKKKLKEEYNDSWVYILLLTTLTILIQSIKAYKFMINGSVISYSVLLIPGVFFISNYISKKYDYKKAIAAIAISGVVFTCYVMLVSYSLGRGFAIKSIAGDLCGYIVAQFVNLMIYEFLLNNTTSPHILVFLNYLFAIIIYYMFYTLINLNMVIQDGYWTKYFITMIIEFILCFPITIMDKYIKRGRE